jgi:teichuronic acid biosynthesis glycosyltransferase TuaC
MRVIQIVGGHKPAIGSRLNIFVHRQVSSLKTLIPDTHIIHAGMGSSLQDMISLAIRIRHAVKAVTPDVIHSQYGTLTGAITVMTSGRVPTVISFGGDEIYGTYINELSTKSLRTYLALKASKYCAQKATVCIAKNETMRKILKKWGAKRVEVIPNGVNLDLFKELPQGACRAQLGLKSDVQYVIFAVREKDYVKRADLAKRAVELCNFGSSQKVELLILDNVDPKLIPIYLNAGNVLLLCSNHEGSPNIVKEALACNRPVVSTDVGDLRERFSSVDGLFLVRQNPSDLAEGLREAIRLKRSNGRDFVKDLSEEIVAKRLVDLYHALTSCHAQVSVSKLRTHVNRRGT